MQNRDYKIYTIDGHCRKVKCINTVNFSRIRIGDIVYRQIDGYDGYGCYESIKLVRINGDELVFKNGRGRYMYIKSYMYNYFAEFDFYDE